MDELIAFLRARLDDDERIANAATLGSWTAAYDGAMHEVLGTDGVAWIAFTGDEGGEPEPRVNAIHIARHDPARVLADVAAKRAVVFWSSAALRVVEADRYALDVDRVLMHLASAYADHPDYREAWRP